MTSSVRKRYSDMLLEASFIICKGDNVEIKSADSSEMPKRRNACALF